MTRSRTITGLGLFATIVLIAGVLMMPVLARRGPGPQTSIPQCTVQLGGGSVKVGGSVSVGLKVKNAGALLGLATFAGNVTVTKATGVGTGPKGYAEFSFTTDPSGNGLQTKLYPSEFGPDANTASAGRYDLVGNVAPVGYAYVGSGLACVASFNVK